MQKRSKKVDPTAEAVNNFQQFMQKPCKEVGKWFSLILKKRATAKVWNYFHAVNEIKAGAESHLGKFAGFKAKDLGCCNICGEVLGIKGGTTNNLHNHLKNTHGLDLKSIAQEVVQFQQPNIKSALNQGVLKFGQAYEGQQLEAYQLRQTAKWIAKCNLPLSLVERPQFRNMIKSYNPTAKFISSSKLRKEISTLSDLIRKLRNE